MTSPRIRRLQSDYDRIVARFTGFPLVQIELAEGHPPDMYRIWYNIKGLYVSSDECILERDEHVLEVRLSLEYPRRAPQLRLLTPIFHPNFSDRDVCAQDIYAASEGLDDLIVRIGRMIAYQEYNTKSPLNGIAAKWAAENSHRLPVDRREIAPLGSEAQVSLSAPPIEFIEQKDNLWDNQIVISKEDVVVSPENLYNDPGKNNVQSPSNNAISTLLTEEKELLEADALSEIPRLHSPQNHQADASTDGDSVIPPTCKSQKNDNFVSPSTPISKDSNKNLLAFWGVICALLGLMLPVPIIDLLVSVAGTVMSIIAVKKVKRRRLAIAGIVIGSLGIIKAIFALSIYPDLYFEIWDFLIFGIL